MKIYKKMNYKTYKTMNVIGYVRVSTDEQAERGFSIDYQKSYIKNYCQSLKLNLVDIYADDCSAKNFNRPNYKRMKAYALKKSNHIDKVIVVRWDRFARNLSQALIQIEQFKKHDIEINSIEQAIDYNQTDYIVMLSMYLSTSHCERLKISRRVKECNYMARKNGRYTNGNPAKGYRWRKHSRDEASELLVDEPVAALVKEAFELYATGMYSTDGVRQIMNEKGLKMHKQSFINMLKNRLYVGEVHVPSYNGSKDEWVKGIHQPIIGKMLFNRVQELLDGKKKNHPKAKSKVVPELFLRNFLICPVCGCNMTGSFSKGRSGERYPYYHCNHSGHQRIKARDANSRFVQLLNEITPSAEVLELFSLIVNDLKHVAQRDIKEEMKKTGEEIEQLLMKINATDDMLISKEIDKETHARIVSRNKQCIRELEAKRELLKSNDIKAMKEKLDYSKSILANLGDYFQRADDETKIRLLGSILTGKMQFSENGYRTTGLNEVLVKIALIPNGLQDVEKEKASKIAGLSNLALRLGLEPRTL